MKINENMNSPFFILGNPRSGTSLFRLMLNSHPNIIVPPESGFLQWWYEKYKNWDRFDSQSENAIKEYVHDILSSKKIEDWNLISQELIDEIKERKPNNYGELSTVIYLSYKNNSKSEVQLVGDKNNYYIHHLLTLDSIYPNASYIHLIRDGRDVACSYKKIQSLKSNSNYMPNLASKINDIATEWDNNINKIDSFLNNKKFKVVRYEDLLRYPEQILSKVCGFLNISYHSRMLDYYKLELNDEPISTLDWKRKTLEPIDFGNMKKYLTILSPFEINIFNKIAKNSLKLHGYEV